MCVACHGPKCLRPMGTVKLHFDLCGDLNSVENVGMEASLPGLFLAWDGTPTETSLLRLAKPHFLLSITQQTRSLFSCIQYTRLLVPIYKINMLSLRSAQPTRPSSSVCLSCLHCLSLVPGVPVPKLCRSQKDQESSVPSFPLLHTPGSG